MTSANCPSPPTCVSPRTPTTKKLPNVGLIKTVTALRGFRQDFIDERMGVAGAHVMVEESGAPVMLVVRLKVVDDKLTEIELVTTHSRSEGADLQPRWPEGGE